MTPFIHFFVVGNVYSPVSLCRNDDFCAAQGQVAAQVIGVEGFIAEESVEAQSFDQRRRADDLTALAGMQREANEIAQRVRQRQYFRRQAAFRAADGLILSPPFAPLVFW